MGSSVYHQRKHREKALAEPLEDKSMYQRTLLRDTGEVSHQLNYVSANGSEIILQVHVVDLTPVELYLLLQPSIINFNYSRSCEKLPIIAFMK